MSALERLDTLTTAADRVIRAFKAHGVAKGVVDTLTTRQECERSMVALEATLRRPTPTAGEG